MEVDIIVETKIKKGFLSYDNVFKSVFIDQENILGKMISDITWKSVDEIKKYID